jgi:cytochrome c553
MRLGLFILLLLSLCVQAPAQAARAFEDSMAQRTRACTACHGEQGRAGHDGYYPRLAGKPAGYLFNQLQNFRAGRRHYPLMTGLLDTLDDAYLQELAHYFSALRGPYPAPKPTPASAGDLERGRRLAHDGDRAQGIPACTQCHGLQLTGVNPATPGLLGLPADYLNAQLGGWQTGQRHAAAPDCMATIAKRLSATDSNALARWLSAQPLPADAHAVDHQPPPGPATLDIACGSAVLAAKQSPAAPATTPAAPTGIPSVAPAAAPAEAAQIERGRYLARIGNCATCHTARGGAAYAGGRSIDTPFGAVYSSNLTPDPQRGLGRWSAEDFWHALHEGLSKDGHALLPAFPYTSYTRVSRTDADALFAYLKSLPPVSQANLPHALRWPFGSSLALRVWRALFFTPFEDKPSTTGSGAGTQAQAANRADLQRGAYLVQGLGHCMECHGARNRLGALKQGTPPEGAVLPGSQWLAPSLHAADGASVANWSTAAVAAFLTTGQNRHAQASGPMAEVVLQGTQYLSAADAQAMAVYLKALPQATPARSTTAAAVGSSLLQKGSALYETHCADCHGLQGEGQAGAYPALAGNRAVTLQPPNNLIHTVLSGGFAPATAGNPRPFGMPPFVLQLRDADLAAILSYIRNAWGNRADGISEFDINNFRRSQAP